MTSARRLDRPTAAFYASVLRMSVSRQMIASWTLIPEGWRVRRRIDDAIAKGLEEARENPRFDDEVNTYALALVIGRLVLRLREATKAEHPAIFRKELEEAERSAER